MTSCYITSKGKPDLIYHPRKLKELNTLPAEILHKKVYLGSFEHSQDKEGLSGLGIKHIVRSSLSLQPGLSPYLSQRHHNRRIVTKIALQDQRFKPGTSWLNLPPNTLPLHPNPNNPHPNPKVNVSSHGNPFANQGFEYLKIDVPDTVEGVLQPYFEECNAFMKKAIAEGSGVLVHCHRGMSRSSTMVIAYMMAEMGMSLEEGKCDFKKPPTGTLRICVISTGGYGIPPVSAQLRARFIHADVRTF